MKLKVGKVEIQIEEASVVNSFFNQYLRLVIPINEHIKITEDCIEIVRYADIDEAEIVEC